MKKWFEVFLSDSVSMEIDIPPDADEIDVVLAQREAIRKRLMDLLESNEFSIDWHEAGKKKGKRKS